MISRLPANAPNTAATCLNDRLSFKISILNRMAKNGDILFSMEASASTRWSTA